MSEIEKTTKDASIRGQMNLMFATMRMLATVLELAPDNQMAREAIASSAESVWAQSVLLHHIVQEYVTALKQSSET